MLLRRLRPGDGLLLVPCSSVHTFLVGFPIDVVLLDRTGRVLDVQRNIRPGRVVPSVAGTYAVLELPAGSATIAPGCTLRLHGNFEDDRIPPKAAMFLWHPS